MAQAPSITPEDVLTPSVSTQSPSPAAIALFAQGTAAPQYTEKSPLFLLLTFPTPNPASSL